MPTIAGRFQAADLLLGRANPPGQVLLAESSKNPTGGQLEGQVPLLAGPLEACTEVRIAKLFLEISVEICLIHVEEVPYGIVPRRRLIELYGELHAKATPILVCFSFSGSRQAGADLLPCRSYPCVGEVRLLRSNALCGRGGGGGRHRCAGPRAPPPSTPPRTPCG